MHSDTYTYKQTYQQRGWGTSCMTISIRTDDSLGNSDHTYSRFCGAKRDSIRLQMMILRSVCVCVCVCVCVHRLKTQIPLGSSRHLSTRHDTFDVSSPCILAVSSLSNSTARHALHDELDWLDTSNVSCPDMTWHDEPRGIWA